MRLAGVAVLAALALAACTVRRIPVGLGPPFLRVEALTRVSDLPATSPPAWAPDSRRLAFGAEDGVWIAAADRRAARPLAALRPATLVAWAPDGRRLAALAGGVLYALALDGAPPQPLVPAGGVRLFAWDPAGGRIAYVAGRGGRQELRVWEPPGHHAPGHAVPGALVPIAGAAEVRALDWLPGGRGLFVALGPRGDPRATRLLRIDLAAPGRTDARPGGAGSPAPIPGEGSMGQPVTWFGSGTGWALAPGGRFLAYVGGGPGPGRARVVVARPDGTGRRGLTPAGAYSGLAWSPSGTLLAFASAAGDGEVRLLIADVTTGERLEVADYRPEIASPGGVLAVRWAPDGLALAFGTDTGETAGPVWVARLSRL